MKDGWLYLSFALLAYGLAQTAERDMYSPFRAVRGMSLPPILLVRLMTVIKGVRAEKSIGRGRGADGRMDGMVKKIIVTLNPSDGRSWHPQDHMSLLLTRDSGSGTRPSEARRTCLDARDRGLLDMKLSSCWTRLERRPVVPDRNFAWIRSHLADLGKSFKGFDVSRGANSNDGRGSMAQRNIWAFVHARGSAGHLLQV